VVNVVTCLLIKAAILNHRVPLRKLRLRALMTMTTRLGLPLCHGTGAPLRRTQAPPGPFDFFLIIMVTISVDRQHYR